MLCIWAVKPGLVNPLYQKRGGTAIHFTQEKLKGTGPRQRGKIVIRQCAFSGRNCTKPGQNGGMRGRQISLWRNGSVGLSPNRPINQYRHAFGLPKGVLVSSLLQFHAMVDGTTA